MRPYNLPPQVFVARTNRRGEAVAAHERDAAWMRAFLEEHVRIDDPDVVRRCERAVVRAHGNSVVLKRFLRDVAMTLTRSDTWRATTTPDFVVLPLGFELDDPAKVLKHIAPERLAAIQAGRWLTGGLRRSPSRPRSP